jgi:quinol monooxygenase YgiN
MTDNVYWMLTLKINDGKLDDFKRLATEMSVATKDEPGALVYEWHLAEDGSTCHIYERYADSSATMTHLGNFGSKFAERFMALATPQSFFVYGKPNDQVKGALADFGAAYLTQFAGFVR